MERTSCLFWFEHERLKRSGPDFPALVSGLALPKNEINCKITQMLSHLLLRAFPENSSIVHMGEQLDEKNGRGGTNKG